MRGLAFASVLALAGAITWLGCGSDDAFTQAGAASSGSGGASSAATTSAASSGSVSTTGNGGAGSAPIFETDIVPIFNSSCGAKDNACHSRVAYDADKASGCRGWLSLEDASLGAAYYSGANQGDPTGCPDMPLYDRLLLLDAWQCTGPLIRYVVPCDPDSSYIIHKTGGGPYCDLAPGQPSDPMPQDAAMDPTEYATMRAWIAAGAPKLDGTGVDCDGGGGSGGGPVGLPPAASIWHPSDMEDRPANVDIPFIGAAPDPEDGDLSGASLVWSTNLAGVIGTGKQFSAPLAAGVHLVTLTATDADGNQGAASITLNIQ